MDDSGESTRITVGRVGTTITGAHTYDVDFTVSGALSADAGRPGTAACDSDTKNGPTVMLKQAHLDADQQLTEQIFSAAGSAILPTASAGQYPVADPSTEQNATATSSAGLYPFPTDPAEQYAAPEYTSSGSKSHDAGFIFLGAAACVGFGLVYLFSRGRSGGGGSRGYSGTRYRSSWSDNSSFSDSNSWTDTSSWSDSGSFSSGSDSGGFSGGSSGDSGQSGGW